MHCKHIFWLRPPQAPPQALRPYTAPAVRRRCGAGVARGARVLGATIILTLAAACAGPATPTEVMEDAEHGGETAAEQDHSDERVPNDGAVIRIVSPADGETISGNEIEVKVETENFALGEDGRHWHVYLDGDEVAMITGTDASYVLHGLTPGDHEIEVTLANGDHIELEEGAAIHVTVSP